jgi:hypothetical protein
VQASLAGVASIAAEQHPQPRPVQGKIHHGTLLQRLCLAKRQGDGKNLLPGGRASSQIMVLDVAIAPGGLSPSDVQHAVLEEQGQVLRKMLQVG